MLALNDYFVIAAYFVFTGALGWYFRKFSSNTSDYFRGGGVMPWWLVGASSFISAFSAWTFTGAAGLAYDRGVVVVLIYLANAVGLLVAAFCLAAWYRQTGVITAMEAVARRFGRANEQIFTWLQIPVQILTSGVWLYGMAIFLAPIFGLDVRLCIVFGGFVVVLMSTLGGSWAVMTGDFFQTLILIPVTGIVAWASLARIGGLTTLSKQLPAGHLHLLGDAGAGFGVLWLAALLVEKVMLQNGLPNSTRFLSVRDSSAARKAAMLATILTIVGGAFWFLPPLAARALHLDLAAKFPGLNVSSEGAYAAMAIDLLPHGLLGLMVTGIIGTTLSAMDTGLNRNAGIFVRSIYHPTIRPSAGERELVVTGKITTLVMGSLVMAVAFMYSGWSNVGAFRLMMGIAAMLGVPAGIPMFLCLFIRKTPDWAGWSTLLLGFVVSAVLFAVPSQPRIFGAEFSHWLSVNEYTGRMLINASVCSIWFVSTTLFPARLKPARADEVSKFFTAMKTPLVRQKELPEDRGIPLRVSLLCGVFGAALLLIALLPNSLQGHAGLGGCAAFFFVIAILLKRSTPDR